MHPLLAGPGRLGCYLLLWALFAVVPASNLAMATAIGWGASMAVMVPACVLFGVATLPLWFVCLALPLHLHLLPPARLAAAHATVGALWTSVWLALIALGMAVLAFLGDTHIRSAPWAGLAMTGVMFYGLALAFHYLLRNIDDMRLTQEEHAALTLAHREAALAALKARIHPHFLFNSLNAISALVTQQPQKARDLCVTLADFLRQSLTAGDKQRIPLADELTLVDNYLAIETVRLGERLQITMNIAPDTRTLAVPPLLLQPLVENAIKHGIARRPDGGTLIVEAWCETHRLNVRITNPRAEATAQGDLQPHSGAQPRAGTDPRIAPPTPLPAALGLGLGLDNVQRRLATLYGTRATFKVQPGPDTFCVTLAWPCETAS